MVILGENLPGASGVLDYKDKVVENNKSNWPKTNLRDREEKDAHKIIAFSNLIHTYFRTLALSELSKIEVFHWK